MTLAEYQKEAKRTCNDLGNPEENMMHMVVGATTEFGEVLDLFKKKLAYGKEVDLLELKLEAGDVAYYLINAITFLGNEVVEGVEDEEAGFPEFNKNSPLETCGLVLGLSTSFTDMVSKDGYYSSELFLYYLLQLKNLLEAFDINFGEALQANIDKLKARYPDKFTNELALNRDLDKEYKAVNK